MIRNVRFMTLTTGSQLRNTRFINRISGSWSRNIRFFNQNTGSLTSSGSVFSTNRNDPPLDVLASHNSNTSPWFVVFSGGFFDERFLN